MARPIVGTRASGAVGYSIDSTEIMASAARTLSEVLQARVPGLDVLQSGGVAAQGAQIRSRGAHSFFMAGEPIVIVDGVRVNAMQDATVVDVNVSTSRLDDIAPEDIATIDVLPGAAAAGIYGPGAAGGALIVTTKRGADGGIHFATRARAGVGMIATSFPPNYQLQGTLTATGQPGRCVLFQVATGDCTPTGVEQWNPLENASPFRVARTSGEAIAIDGGVRQTSGRLSLTADRTLGVTGDDDATRLGARATVTQHIGRSFVLTGSGAAVQTSAGLPTRGDIGDASNVIANGFFGAAAPDSIQGYRPTQVWTSTRERAHHWTAGATAIWDGLSWLHLEGRYGMDRVRERDARPGAFLAPSMWFQTFELGSLDHNLTTAVISASTAEWTFFHPTMRTRTIATVDQLRSTLTAEDSLAVVNVAPPLVGITGMGAKWRIADEALRQEWTWDDRVRLGAGARWERWSEFGTHLPTHFFKSADLSWRLGRVLRVDSLRLRAAYGEAGNWSPGEPTRVGMAGGFGLPDPESRSPEERAAERELGADFAFAHRASVSLTIFRADASHLYTFNPPTSSFPPIGTPNGALRNDGLELASRILLLRRGPFQWDAVVRGDLLRDRTRSVGPYNQWIINGGAMDRPGHPVGSYFQRPYTYTDANHDGLISPSEIQYGPFLPADAVGSSLPNREASVLSTWSFAHGVRFSALLDYRGGQKLANMAEAWRCASYRNCRAVNDPSAPLADQAQALVGIQGPLAFVEGASFLKWRELSLQWVIPSRFARFLGGSGAITIAGRNLATWTHYRGLDPELNEQPLNMLPRVDYAETPFPREVALRFDLGGK
jgi:outer membrane receptor protein involved in Fe transport